MTLSTALSNATTALAANARSVEVISANIANAQTPGYAPRSVILTAASLGGIGGGVRFVGVERNLSPGLAALSRDAAAERSADATRATFWREAEGAIGTPGDPRSLSMRIDTLGAALIDAAARPDLQDRLQAVVDAADTVLRGFATAQDRVQDARVTADAQITSALRSLSDGLEQVHALNRQIRQLQHSGQSPLALLDDRDAVIARLSEIVPLREIARSDGSVALYSQGGTRLLDAAPAQIVFTPTPAFGPAESVGGGTLSGLSVNGVALADPAGGQMAGGRLGALFAIRDRDGPAAQAALDAMAQDLALRFQAAGTDPSLPPGAPGLFTDGGAAIVPPAAAGLAQRLALNSAVLPEQGGALFRLRDGLGATLPGPTGSTAQIERWRAALDMSLSPAPGQPAVPFAERVARLLSDLSQSRQNAEDRAMVSESQFQHVEAQRLSAGVDTDAEVQRLLLIEQSYAANARVIQVVDDMLRRLMEI